MTGNEDGVLATGIVVLGLYFLPLIVANVRKKRSKMAISMLNLLFGWTIIGWIGAFIWALTMDDLPRQALMLVQHPSQPARYCTGCGTQMTFVDVTTGQAACIRCQKRG